MSQEQIQGPTLPAEGGCRCGKVRFRIAAPPLLTMACHCRGCQRMTGSAYSLSASIPTPGFAVIAGEPVLAGTGQPPMHYACPDCMSWVFTRPVGIDFFVNIRPSLLDEPAWTEPFIETQTAEALPWATTPAKHSFARWPAENAWQRLIAEYQKAGAEPGGPPGR